MKTNLVIHVIEVLYSSVFQQTHNVRGTKLLRCIGLTVGDIFNAAFEGRLAFC